MAFATPEAIRDRIIALIEAIAPTSLTADKFRVSRDEASADFRAWSEQNKTACLRRVQVRNPGARTIPLVTNHDAARHELTLNVLIAYPNTHRYGVAAARDRDDVIDEDFRKLDYAIGIYGRANFSGTHDCCPLGLERNDDERGDGVTFLSLTWRGEYVLDVDA